MSAPKKILLPQYRKQVLLVAAASITNYSSRVLRDVRIKLPFIPDVGVEATRNLPDTTWTFDSSAREIRIPFLDPGVNASFELYTTPAPLVPGEAAFLVEDQTVSRRSQFLAAFHGLGSFERAAYIALLLLLLLSVGGFYWIWRQQAQAKHQSSLMAQTGTRRCDVKTLSKMDGTLTYAGLRQNKLGGVQGAIDLNAGRDVDELLSRDEAWICHKVLESDE